MIVIIQIVSIIICISEPFKGAILAPIFIPAIYTATIGQGAFFGGTAIDVDKLKERLHENWNHEAELAEYMRKYWTGLEYIFSAPARQSTCTLLSFLCAGCATYYYLALDYSSLSALSALYCVVLYLMALRVNRPLGMYKDTGLRNKSEPPYVKEYMLAVTSLVAFSELFPDSTAHKHIADNLYQDEYAKSLIEQARI